MVNKEYLAKVRESKTTKQKQITIPKEATEIKGGDWVAVRKAGIKYD